MSVLSPDVIVRRARDQAWPEVGKETANNILLRLLFVVSVDGCSEQAYP